MKASPTRPCVAVSAAKTPTRIPQQPPTTSGSAVAVEQGQHTVAYDRGGGADLFIGDEARRGIAARV